MHIYRYRDKLKNRKEINSRISINNNIKNEKKSFLYCFCYCLWEAAKKSSSTRGRATKALPPPSPRA